MVSSCLVFLLLSVQMGLELGDEDSHCAQKAEIVSTAL